MEFWTILSGILVLLGTAFAAGVLFERLGQSAVLGYLLAGLVLGPHTLGLAVAEAHTLSQLAELGVTLLLFTIGLEFSLSRLWRLGRVGLLGGLVQVSVTVALACVVALFFGLRAQAAVGIGAIIAFSSTACVLRVLSDRGMIDSVHGRNAVGMLLLQDLAVVPLVLVISMLGHGALEVSDLLVSMVRSVGFFVAMTAGFWAFANYILPRVLRTSALLANRELLILLAALLSLGSAWIAHSLGISPALGAFVAGMVLAESPYALQARADIGPLRTLFATLFFVSIGMLGDPGWIAENALAVVVAGTLVIGGKIILVAIIVRAFRHPWPEAIATAVCLAQIGEFSFIVAQQVFLHTGTVQDRWLFDLVVSVSIISLLLTPYLVRLAPILGRLFLRRGHHAHLPVSDGATEHTGPGVVVVGYGVAGQQLVEPLLRHGVSLTIVDFQPANIQSALSRGFAAIVGDARDRELLEHLHVRQALAVVVALPDHQTVVTVIHQVRALAPGIPIIARARYHRYAGEIIAAGASVVVDEEQQIGRRLGLEARRLLRQENELMARQDTDNEEQRTRSWTSPPIHLAKKPTPPHPTSQEPAP
jgi:CPA2 family monovalent cation:H+ antiporter-2